MTVAENLGPLVGRAVEIEVLRSEVAAVRTGIPRIVVAGAGGGPAGRGRDEHRQVAGELFISVKTVHFHLTHIYTKLGVSSRAELAAQYRN